MRAGDFERDGDSGLYVPRARQMARQRGVQRVHPEFMCGPAFFGGASGGSGGGGSASDPYFSYVSLLLHGNGVNGSTSIVDSSANNLTATAGGNASISTASPKFGSGAINFDGNGDSVKYASNSKFDLAAGDATIEFFYRPTTESSTVFHAFFSRCQATSQASNPYWAFIYNNTAIYWRNAAGNELVAPVSFSFTNGTYYHLAFVKDGSSFRIYQNGVQLTSGSSNSITDSAQPFYIGSLNDATHSCNGMIDEFRFTQGICRYPSGISFTPPAAAFS